MPKALTKQIEYAGTIKTVYGFDKSNSVEYYFDSDGFRNKLDCTVPPDIVFAGGSISFGIGVPYDKCYGQLVANELGLLGWNISYAQEYYDNEIIFETILQLYQQVKNIPLVIQWVSDKRNPADKKSCYQLINETNSLFNNCIHLLIDGREAKENIIAGTFDLINPPWLDTVANSTHPGIKTHQELSKYILKKLYDKTIIS